MRACMFLKDKLQSSPSLLRKKKEKKAINVMFLLQASTSLMSIFKKGHSVSGTKNFLKTVYTSEYATL